MDKQQIGLKLALDAVGLRLDLGTFNGRLILQKSVCLIQSAGVHLGYHFQWYLRGPYSPSLTRDAFSIDGELKEDRDDSHGWSLDPQSCQRLEGLKDLFDTSDQAALANRLELLASTLFLIERTPVGRPDTATLRETLRRYGKEFSEQQIEEALNELRRHELLAERQP